MQYYVVKGCFLVIILMTFYVYVCMYLCVFVVCVCVSACVRSLFDLSVHGYTYFLIIHSFIHPTKHLQGLCGRQDSKMTPKDPLSHVISLFS